MYKQSLNGTWRMKRADSTEWINGTVPGSVFYDLLNAGMMEDPFYRENEDQAKILASYDYEYERTFTLDNAVAESEKVILRCDGLDTLAEIWLNGQLVAETNNMHRTYEFDIKSILSKGGNKIRVLLKSPMKFIEQKHEEYPLWGVADAVPGYPHLRKAHYMFGWDWGPQIPDLGIWRDIQILGFTSGRLDDVYITQLHEENSVSLDIRVRHQNWGGDSLNLDVKVTAPDGDQIVKSVQLESLENHISIDIADPKLWWPNTYGEQPLYGVEVLLRRGDSVIDSKVMDIGLRTLRVKREKDQWGESFEFEINGISIFAMGADYIPEDNILPRRSPEKTEKLIKDCVEANYNSIRVWGGGYYPDDFFYELCDRYGLIVWQDFMFACAVYDMNEEFTENIIHEAEDNVKRIRHHACLGLWCGNNEMETAFIHWGIPQTPKLKTDYIKQYEIYLPQVVKEYDPNTFYWPSSPSSGGGFDDPNSQDKGDVHYWDVWHGLKPFTEYRKFYFRFVSEFGFQSFPSLKTVESFTLPEDRNIFSPVMENHQKNAAANGKILYYLSETFKYPKSFDSLLYASQVLQAEAIKYGVEHWRRHRGRCMGSIYWQINDCWPVASWSSIDSFGRWKALHYFAKKFYSPLLLSAAETGTAVQLNVANDTMKPVTGMIGWKLRNNKSEVIKEGTKDIAARPLSAETFVELDFSDILTDKYKKRSAYLEYSLIVDNKTVSSATVLFEKPKHFEFLDPQIGLDVKELEDKFVVLVNAKAYAKYVELDTKDIDCKFSENYFDISAGTEKEIEIKKEELPANMTVDELKSKVKVRSAFDI